MSPVSPPVDSTVPLWRHGYMLISSTCDRLGTDAFATRLLGKPVVCMRGADAGQFFYRPGAFSRPGALLASVTHLLQDDGSVQSLDGPAHFQRKAMFLDMLPTGAARVLTNAALQWAGIAVTERRAQRLATQLDAMVRWAGSFGPYNWWARWQRRDAKRWAATTIRSARDSGAANDSPLGAIARHRDQNDELLSPDIAAVELLDLLRPIVAVGLFVTFAAVALTQHPQWRETFVVGDDDWLPAFVDEVRRYYPFFPMMAGCASTARCSRWHPRCRKRSRHCLSVCGGTIGTSTSMSTGTPSPVRYLVNRTARCR